ncbi:MAG: hypothetical protein KJ880_01100, partial [Candidatus Omnitrophica bacterium]|nr:hypothetical protein [Candidatus Omnitrophota bacterium]
MKIALVQCPAFGIDRPPLALGYLAAYLRVNNYQTDIFDFNIDLYSRSNDDEKKFWDFQYVFQWLDKDYFSNQGFLPEEYFRDWAKQITESGCRIAGFSVQSSSLRASIKLASELKRIAPETVIIFGGPLHLSYSIGHAYHLLQLEQPCGKKTVDIVAMGEGEQVLVEILNRIKSGSSLDGCQGTVLRENGRIVNNGLCPLIHDLDCLPFPDFSRFPLGRYKHKNRLPILGSRGCIFRCLFCDDSRMWRTYRSRTAENIINEIRIRKEEGVEFLEFN